MNYLALTLYVGAIVAANVMTAHMGLVSVGFGLLVTAGTFAAGFALLARDFVHRYAGIRWVFIAIGIGAALSWALASPGLALASTVAFTGAELIDLAVYSPVSERRGFFLGALASNIVSAPIDTVLFLWVAGFQLTAAAVGGQFIGKVVWATLIPLAVYIGARRALLREPVNPERA